jgi:hypothetical protein
LVKIFAITPVHSPRESLGTANFHMVTALKCDEFPWQLRHVTCAKIQRWSNNRTAGRLSPPQPTRALPWKACRPTITDGAPSIE